MKACSEGYEIINNLWMSQIACLTDFLSDVYIRTNFHVYLMQTMEK